MKRSKIALLAIFGVLSLLLACPALVQAETVERVSVSDDEEQSDCLDIRPTVNEDGTVVAFVSWATNLVEGDTNGVADVFVRDRDAGTTTRVNVSSEGEQADSGYGAPGEPPVCSISADGDLVAFDSLASNLVEGDTNQDTDVFVHARETGTTTRLSVNSDEEQADGRSLSPSISGDGSVVAFTSSASNLVGDDANGVDDVFLRDLGAGITTLVSMNGDEEQGNGHSGSASVNADGTVIAFASYATNLVDGDDNGFLDVFVRDLIAGTTVLVSQHSDGTRGNGDSHSPSISADGRYVAFESTASNLVDDDINHSIRDIFVRDLVTGVTELVSASSDGEQAWDWKIDEAPGSHSPSISGDGSVVIFSSDAANLVDGDTNDTFDVFARNLDEGTTTRVSVNAAGEQGNDGSGGPGAISFDGTLVVFCSDADNLVSGDTNGWGDIFVKSLEPAKKKATPKRYEQSDERILYTGGFTEDEGQEYSGGSLLVTSDPSATITVTFKGRQLDWIATLGPDMGKALVSVDGGEAVLVDLSNPTELLQQVVWSTGRLEYGVHTVTITFATGDDYVEGGSINVDAFDVHGGYLIQSGEPKKD